jgi:hypothetical protein
MLRGSSKSLISLTVCGGLIAAAAFAGCGGSSGTERKGTGGSTGSGGATGSSGGSTGSSGGSSGSSGGSSGSSGGATGAACANLVAPAVPLLADFAGADTAHFGTSDSKGSPFGYAGDTAVDAGTMTTGKVAIENGSLHFTGDVKPGGYAGGGMSFDNCANVSAYTGISFKIAGSIGTCALELQTQIFSDKSTSTGGACASGCGFPVKRNVAIPTSTQTTVTVRFSDLTGGTPNTFRAMELVGLQWQVTVPPGADGGAQVACPIDYTIDDVTLIN